MRENQRHIGERCVILLKTLVRTALEAAVKEACGLNPEIQKTSQKHYISAVEAIRELGFICSLSNKDLGLHFNFPIGKYKVDYFISSLSLVLECNGYSHRYYDPKEEKEREEIITQKYGLIRFHHKVAWEKLVNAILQIKPGKIIRLYNLGNMC